MAPLTCMLCVVYTCRRKACGRLLVVLTCSYWAVLARVTDVPGVFTHACRVTKCHANQA